MSEKQPQLPTAVPAAGIRQRISPAVLFVVLAASLVLWEKGRDVYIVRRIEPTSLVLTVSALGLLALLLLLRREPGCRWIVTVLALTAGPLFLSLLLRTQSGYSISRYAYQTFLAVAVAAGATLDLFLATVKNRIAVVTGSMVLLAAAAPVYYRSQQERLSRILTALEQMQTKPSLHRDYWMG